MTNKIILAAFVLISMLTICACVKSEPPIQSPPPYVLHEGNKVKLNTFSLAQGDFPILYKKPDPDKDKMQIIAKKKAVAGIIKKYRQHGYKVKANKRFNWGKIHVKFDAFDNRHKVGFIFITDDDYEKAKGKDGKPTNVSGGFYTVKSPDKLSTPELLSLEKLNAEERLYIAFINANQFRFSKIITKKEAVNTQIPTSEQPINDQQIPEKGHINSDKIEPLETDSTSLETQKTEPQLSENFVSETKALQKLYTRVEMYLEWLNSRMAERKARFKKLKKKKK